MDPTDLSPAQFQDFGRLIEEHLGIKMPETKRIMLQSRLQRRAHVLGLRGPGDYHQRFFTEETFRAEELQELYNLATTNKTDFLREAEHFRYLTDILVARHRAEAGGREFRLWCAGCSTGEEPYTLAMVLAEEGAGQAFPFSIVATDVSMRALEIASRGRYAEERVSPLPSEWRTRYLRPITGRREWQVEAELRSRITFGHLNFLASRYGVPGPFDVIFFRNVMIYFDRATQREVVSRMMPLLRDRGHLLTANAETLHGLGLPVKQVGTAVYQKTARTLPVVAGVKEAVC